MCLLGEAFTIMHVVVESTEYILRICAGDCIDVSDAAAVISEILLIVSHAGRRVRNTFSYLALG